MFNPFEFLYNHIHAGHLVKGPKICNLDPIEVMEFDVKIKRMKDLQEARKAIDIEMEETGLMMRKWWLFIRRKYKIETENVAHEDGVVYEVKIKN